MAHIRLHRLHHPDRRGVPNHTGVHRQRNRRPRRAIAEAPAAGDEVANIATPNSGDETEPAGESDVDTLARLIGKDRTVSIDVSSARAAAAGLSHAAGKVDITALIRDRIAPYIIPDADPRQDLYTGRIGC